MVQQVSHCGLLVESFLDAPYLLALSAMTWKTRMKSDQYKRVTYLSFWYCSLHFKLDPPLANHIQYIDVRDILEEHQRKKHDWSLLVPPQTPTLEQHPLGYLLTCGNLNLHTRWLGIFSLHLHIHHFLLVSSNRKFYTPALARACAYIVWGGLILLNHYNDEAWPKTLNQLHNNTLTSF